MNNDDVALFKHAEKLSYSGQTFAAYEIFRGLQARYPEQIEVLFWIVETTPNLVESRQVLDTIKRLQPGHPLIPRMEALHNRKLEAGYTPSPALNCPYCGQRAPARMKSKVSVGGWIWFAVWFILFLCFMWAPTTVANLSNMEKSAFFCLCVGIVGLFAIRKRTYACGHCGSKITDAS